MATELGQLLKKERVKRGWSLREVERRTEIANAHLSQIETGVIERPDVGVLWTLANVYGVDYPKLLRMAGHAEPKGARKGGRSLAGAALHAVGGDFTPAEERELMRFLEDLRKRRPRPGGHV